MTMNRLTGLVGAFVMVFCALPACAQKVGPRIKTHHESFDFGIVPQNAHVSHVFWLRNTGDEELVIEKIQPNCGCTQAPMDKNRVLPGDSTRVELIFSSSTFDGSVEKFAQIMSNSTGRAPALIFRADVRPDSVPVGPVTVNPRAISLDVQRPAATENGYEMLVTLENTGKTPVTVKTIDLPDRVVSAEPLEVTLAAGESHELRIAFSPDLPGAEFYRSVTFSTSDERQDRLTLPIFKTKRWNDDGRS